MSDKQFKNNVSIIVSIIVLCWMIFFMTTSRPMQYSMYFVPIEILACIDLCWPVLGILTKIDIVTENFFTLFASLTQRDSLSWPLSQSRLLASHSHPPLSVAMSLNCRPLSQSQPLSLSIVDLSKLSYREWTDKEKKWKTKKVKTTNTKRFHNFAILLGWERKIKLL